MTASFSSAQAATLTILTNITAPTPDLISYNLGHFYPGSNTKDWWRYSQVSGARVFVAPSEIEATDDITGRGDGVIDQATFVLRKTALRADPLNTNFINWPYFTNRYETHTLSGANKIRVNYAFGQLRQMGADILVCITTTTNFLTITSPSDWAGKWEVWQHFYAQAFYLGRQYDVRRFQMFNEPDHASAISQTDYLPRLQLASDAVQSAIADVNRIYGKNLVCLVHAPVDTTPSYNAWAQLVVNNRHLNYLGVTDTNFLLLQRYDYHQYDQTPAGYGNNVTSLINSVTAAMAPEIPLPVVITEFNVHTAANFDAIPETLDSPSQYPRFGSIVANLVENGEKELYAFKFGQTTGDAGDNYPIRKNGMHYMDNTNAPYNTGGITKAGEVWRLFNKGFAPGRSRLNFVAASGLSNLDLLTAYDAATGRYYVFSVNNSAISTSLTVDVSAFNIPDNNRAIIEEVSEAASGSVTHYTQVSGGQVTTFTQPSNSVWLITIPAKTQQRFSPTVPTFTLSATDDATVKDGANKAINYGAQTNLIVRNDPANAANRSAALIKVHLPKIYLPDVQLAVLSFFASTISSNVTAQAHVYGLANDDWTQAAVTWATTPNLLQNAAAGNRIINNVITGAGDSAFIEGQVICTSTNQIEVQIDVTDFIRAHTNHDASFLISQDPRWDVTLPSLATGDTQPDGIQIVSLEGAGANSGPRLKLVRLQDTDGDGISDEAETNIFHTDPLLADTDGDGMSDGDEVIAGTDPLSASSNFRVVSVQSAPNAGFKLNWSAVTNRSYQVFRTTSLTNADWQQIYTSPWTNAVMSYTDAVPTNRAAAYYRVQIAQ